MKLFIVELAGRDSYAALYATIKHALKFSNENVYIIPSEIKTPFEYRDKPFNKKELKDRLYEILHKYGLSFNTTTYDNLFNYLNNRTSTTEIRESELWAKLCIPNEKYYNALDTYCPCIGCHLFCHVTRILRFFENCSKLFSNYKDDSIELFLVTGERKSHNGKIKSNQTENIIKEYKKIISNANYGFTYLPIIYDIVSDEEIDFMFKTMSTMLNYSPEYLTELFYKCPISKIFASEKNKGITGLVSDAIDLNCIKYTPSQNE